MAGAVPLICFPFRPFVGILALTAGAVDRLLLGFVGSVPSLAMAAFQTAKNLLRLKQARATVLSALQQRTRDLASAEVHSLHGIFHRCVEEAVPEAARGS